MPGGLGNLDPRTKLGPSSEAIGKVAQGTAGTDAWPVEVESLAGTTVEEWLERIHGELLHLCTHLSLLTKWEPEHAD